MNGIPTPLFVAIAVLSAGAAVLTLPGLAVGAAVLIGRRRRNARRQS